MKKAWVIRLCFRGVLLGGAALAAFSAGVEAQAPPAAAAPRAAQLHKPAPRPLPGDAAAYEALNAHKLDEAEGEFKAVLAQDPRDGGALAGLGYIRLQQANFPGAISYLEQAKQINPNDRNLNEALDTARFWFLMGEAGDAFNAGDLTTAEKRYRSALELRPESAEACAGLGATLLKAQQPAAAVPLFVRVLAVSPDLADGWRGLFLAQYGAGNPAAALTTNQRIPPAIEVQLKGDPLFAETLAAAYSAVGRNGDAEKVLEGALGLSTISGRAKAELQIQLAGVLVAANQLDRAAELYRQAIAVDHGDTAAWEGLIEVEHARGDDPEALATLQAMPAANHAAAMKDTGFESALAAVYRGQKKYDIAQDLLQDALTQQTGGGLKPAPAIEMQLADLFVERGSPQLAYPIYKQVLRDNPNRADAWAGLLSTLHLTGHDSEAIAQLPFVPAAVRAQLENDLGYLQTMAAVFGAQGRSREATQFLGRAEQDYAAQSAEPPADIEIQNAWLLYNGMDDAGLYRQLVSLGQRTNLTEAQRSNVQTIWTNWAVRRANQATAAGNSPRALAILNAAAQAFPDNSAVQKELAKGYAQAGQPHQAVLMYKQQDMSSATAADFETAIGAALAADDKKEAEGWLHDGLAKYPADPQILLLGAKFEQARGNTAAAMRYYRESLSAMPSPVTGVRPGLPGAAGQIGLPSASPAQELAMLLAPGAGAEATPAGALATVNLPVSAEVVPSYMTVPSSAAQPEVGAAPGTQQEVARLTEQAARQLQPAQPDEQTYRPFVPYIAPPKPTPPPTAGANGAVTVQLGNSTPPPVPVQAEKTDVLPTERYAPNNRETPAAVSQPNLAAAQAARVRRQQAEAAARSGQSHPTEDSVTGGAQVPQPAAPPVSSGRGISDTGAQQYPQPRTQPPPLPASVRRPAPATALPGPPPAVVPTPFVESAPVQPQPEPVAPSSPAVTRPLLPQPTSPNDAELALNQPPPNGRGVPIPMTAQQQAQAALAALEGSYSGWLGETGVARYHTGTPGLDRLYDVEAPFEFSAVVDHAVRFTAVARPVFLNSGVLNGASFSASDVPYIGTLPANTAVPPAQQFASGIGGELQMATRYSSVSVGYTPYEFPVHNLTGSVRWRPFGGHLMLYGDREPVKDTQISYAGLRDPGVSTATGPIWGGVIATTGGARLDLGDGVRSGFYISGDGGVLTGRHVLDNDRVAAAAGAFFRVANWPGPGSLTLGGEFVGLHYVENEVGLTYGEGGYFSPDLYFDASVPITLKGAYGSNFHYRVAVSPGVQTYRQAEALFYPLDPLLQSSFVPPVGVTCTAGSAPSYNCGVVPLTVTTSFSYSLDAEASYRFADHWYGGGFVFGDNTYNSTSAGFFLRYAFRKQASSEGRPSGLFPVRGLRPLQIP